MFFFCDFFVISLRLLDPLYSLHAFLHMILQRKTLKLPLIDFSVGVHVLVQDLNEFAPVWPQGGSMRVEIQEGQILDHLVQVRAVDGDCSPQFGDICDYEIQQSENQPFVISKDGESLPTLFYFYG